MSVAASKLEIGDVFTFSEKIWLDEWLHYRVEILAISPKLEAKFTVFDENISDVYNETGKIIKINEKYVEIELDNTIGNTYKWQLNNFDKL